MEWLAHIWVRENEFFMLTVHFQTFSMLNVSFQTFSMLTVHFQTNLPCSLSSFKPTLIVFSLRMIILADPVSGWRIIFTCIFETCIFETCMFEACIYLKFIFWLVLIPTFNVGNEKENPKYNRPKLPQRNLKGTHYCLKKEKGTHFFPKKEKGIHLESVLCLTSPVPLSFHSAGSSSCAYLRVML